ncbi:sensor histidine kinase [Tuberibacillus sp. Marseille-P3662]|uniref:sensor histidine kinase n=1 Tax=Tuberibacillus sp. Marseille-P3662 TaxID=1965358 RepID=UPI001594D22F|nr:sensor histidine kinase [Tuberibacillus sp. Marseille-P3662]
MVLFIKEHVSLVILNIVQLFLLFLVYWLGGHQQPLLALYATGLGLFLLAVFIGVRYIKNRAFYHRIEANDSNLEETINVETSGALSQAVKELLQRQYQYYQNQFEQLTNRQRDYYQFVNQWIHQMKTPLSVIELIIQEGDDDRSRDIQAEIDRLSKGLDMALYVARLEDFRQDFRAEKVNLRAVAQNVVTDNKRYFIRHRVYPDIQISEHLTAASDAKWLPFVLNQLVTNAVKYASGSGTKVTIRGYQSDSHNVALEVIDEGIGIPKEDQQRVFRSFYTGENGRRHQASTGMGLYMVEEICDRLNHEVKLTSEVDQGTTVTILMHHASL